MEKNGISNLKMKLPPNPKVEIYLKYQLFKIKKHWKALVPIVWQLVDVYT